jgi:peptidoglycan hydrolase-like protein with peptidoglycan-binding domain
MGLTITQQTVIAEAQRLVTERIPYKWDGKDPKIGLDCSGMTSACYAAAGVTLDPGTVGQLTDGAAVAITAGANAPFASVVQYLQPCDLIFPAIDHVQLWVGNGQIIEEPQTGEVATLRAEWAQSVYAVRRILPYSVPAGATTWPGVFLQLGSTLNGTGVWRTRLAALGFRLAASTVFDAACVSATVAFQRARGLVTDGVVGPLTWGAAFE